MTPTRENGLYMRKALMGKPESMQFLTNTMFKEKKLRRYAERHHASQSDYTERTGEKIVRSNCLV